MLKWMAKLLGEPSFALPDGVPEAWANSVEKLLAPLDKPDGGKGRGGLAKDILGFVLQGEPLAILGEVGQRPEVGERLHLLGMHFGRSDSGLTEVYQGFDQLPAPVALRWARLLEAAIASHKQYCLIQLPGAVVWPELLMMNSAGSGFGSWSSQRPRVCGLSAVQMEALLIEDGLDPAALLVAAFATPVSSSYGAEQRLMLVSDLTGYAQALDRHLEAVRPLMLPADVRQRLHVLNLLAPADSATLDKLASQLCELATGGSKQVRAASYGLLRRCSDDVVTPLRGLAVDGKPDQRSQALRLIVMLAAERSRDDWTAWARETAAADKAPSVQALIAEWTAAPGVQPDDSSTYQYVLPDIDWSAPANALPQGAVDSFWRALNASVERANQQAREHHARMKAQGHNFPLREDAPFQKADMEALSAYLASDEVVPAKRADSHQRNWRHATPAIQKLAASGGVTPVAVFKLLCFFGLVADGRAALAHPFTQAFAALHQHTGRPTLLELSEMLDQAGHSGQALLRNYCHGWGVPFAADWPDEDVWPFFAHHIDHVVELLTQGTVNDYSFSRGGLFRALATLPQTPPAAVSALFALALGSGKTDRGPAQMALQNRPGKEARIVEALSDGKAETRAIAAQWLGRLRHMDAIPALEKAVAKEKHDVAKGAMLDALQLLGQPVEKYLDRSALAADAAKSLAKGTPKDIDWFPWQAMPPVHWADNGKAVPPDVLKWLLVQAVKQKSPEPNAVLRKYCTMFTAGDREAFGQFVLETWIGEDVRPISPDEAMGRARNQAQSTFQFMKQYPQYYQNDPKVNMTVEELVAAYLPSFLHQPLASASGSKGLLAVAAACCAERAAAPVQRYLKQWYGTRAAQGKALIAMLAWVDHPSATQLMLAVGSRFRTKSFQEEATRQAEALAERKGWTLAELADRTIPSAGFDETGTMELSYGPRAFSARLLPDFKVELFNPDGKKVAALPEPRQDDDAEMAKASKKAFSSARKELKSIVDLQTDRLYEALCTERDWPWADWAAYLQAHPVLRHLVQRLVWVQMADGRVAQSFRPLDDGTLTDVDDNEVHLPEDARVRLAHDSLLSADQVSAWQAHLVDYEVKPLFQQLGKGTYQLPAEQAKLDEIKDFEGHLIEAFALRGRSLKLGYTRGAAEDGGWFYVYEKRFPTLGLQATIEFTGNGLPEENRTVALRSLSFASTAGEGAGQRGKLGLAKVPKVLLSECYNDLRLIAADGSGYDPQWEKKSEY